tara:strand:+ start:258 stop:473 length:216 start_codon:yes stop_codon:yes gene_type:complete
VFNINSAFLMSNTNKELLEFFKTSVEIYRMPNCKHSMAQILELGMDSWLGCPTNDEDKAALEYVYGPKGHA